MQEPWTVKRLLEWSDDYLKEKGAEAPRSDIEIMLSEILGTSRMGVYLNFDKILTPDELKIFKEYLLRRREGVPVQYIIGKAWFYGRPFSVQPGCFIPRFATENLVDIVLKKFAGNKEATQLLEIGGGSGAVSVTLALENTGFTIDTVEKEEKACDMIRANIASYEVSRQVSLLCSDFFSLTPQKKYDAIVCNPPYIVFGDPRLDPQVRDYEPSEALYGGEDGLDFYRRLRGSLEIWGKGSWIFLEIGYNQAEEVARLFAPAEVTFSRDLEGFDRIAFFRWELEEGL
ncbi:MAG TPA: peptide chain release factor N(5)-glutamine methyltransferase [Candidatus Mcinerneyibacteriales bacterium]|nr:peptide chain release factor N(5)-glutamine methyltransferase [Candidatus Mcinerneyibacteriales bacterium]